MKLPNGATKDDFEKCKTIVAKLTNDNNNSDEVILKIMNISYSTGGSYSDETLCTYAKAYFEMNNTNPKVEGI